jgi:hypothetical protein
MAQIPLSNPKPPTYSEVIAEILQPLQEPIAMDELVRLILERRTSNAKNPAQAVRAKVNEERGRQLVVIDGDLALPIRLAMQGIRFRLPLADSTLHSGFLDDAWLVFSLLPLGFPFEQIQFLDVEGKPSGVVTTFLTPPPRSGIMSWDDERVRINLAPWMRRQKLHRKDHLLFTLEDWDNGVFRIEVESAKDVRKDLVVQRDRQLADIFYLLLESSRQEQLTSISAVPEAYARLPERQGYPPHHWYSVLRDDPRMYVDGWLIEYSDSSMGIMVTEMRGEKKPQPKSVEMKALQKKIFRFKAELNYRKNIWRVIEIEGKHTLADLDTWLRSAFEHDPSDHLGGFWKLVARGGKEPVEKQKGGRAKRIRYREVDLGEVDPFGEGEAAPLKIAELGLQVGDRLKYVYDFGDWIEHTILLESIDEPQAGIKVPRVADRNKPRYRYCEECSDKGKKTVAGWLCIDCSNERQEEVLLCDEHAEEHDEKNHFTAEMLY